MNTHSQKSSKNSSRAIANTNLQQQSSEPTAQLEDKRPEALVQKKLQTLANNSSQVAQQRAYGEIANGRSSRSDVIQKASIDPATEFGAPKAKNDVEAEIDSTDQLSGFGTEVNSNLWHTKVTYDPLHTPGSFGGTAPMHPEGSGVTGIVGPDHPKGSQPGSVAAAENNQRAGAIRGMNPHGHVAAHILNDQLGGPGESRNLFALPGNANTLMETQVESKMKTAVQGGNYVYYRGEVHHPANGPADYITMSWNKLDHDGNDIGGGQSNAIIRANNTAANVGDVLQTPGAEAKTSTLLNPSNPTAVKQTPWGPFQMPDPKVLGEVGAFLNYSNFPAVGNKKAFIHFLNDNRNNALELTEMLDTIADKAFFRMWVKEIDKIFGGSFKKTRGLTRELYVKLKHEDIEKRKKAFILIMMSGDANKVIESAAKILAAKAFISAKNRV